MALQSTVLQLLYYSTITAGELYAAVGLLMHVNGLGLSLVTDSVCDNDNDTFISCFLFAL